MIVRCVAIADCADIEGAVVVVDVLRAFSTAAYAAAWGAKRLLLVESLAAALDLAERRPDSLTIEDRGDVLYDSAARRDALAGELEGVADSETVNARVLTDVAEAVPATEATRGQSTTPRARKNRAPGSKQLERGR